MAVAVPFGYVYIIFLFTCAFCTTETNCLRHGIRAKTLHMPPPSTEDLFGAGVHILTKGEDGNFVPTNPEANKTNEAGDTGSHMHEWNQNDISSKSGALKFRHRRSVPDVKRAADTHPSNPENQVNLTVFPLNDSHHQMIVHWAGVRSPVIIALSRDFASPSGPALSSSLYVSYDYGKTFKQRNFTVTLRNGTRRTSTVNQFYNSPTYNSWYVFTDLVHNAVITTKNSLKTYSVTRVPIRPQTITICPDDTNLMLMYDELDFQRRLYFSRNFGLNWELLSSGVKAFFWGSRPYDSVGTVYMERSPFGLNYGIVIRTNITSSRRVLETVFSGVEDFDMRDNYMFATVKPTRYGRHINLYVSYGRQPLRKAYIGRNVTTDMDFYVADASEDQVFLCVYHQTGVTNLYISEVQGTQFSLSLERIVYYNPKGPSGLREHWLRFLVSEPFADIHRVKALRGVYIASQLRNISLNSDQDSFISFDKGGRWRLIPAPQFDQNLKPLNCSIHNGCSLHLSQKFSEWFPRGPPILSKESAPGLIVAAGQASKIFSPVPDVFVSTDGGVSWRLVLKGVYRFMFGDQGGLIAAVESYTRQIRYSWNEGETWESKTFLPYPIHVYGLLTEPGEKSTVFSIFGSRGGRHSWVIVQVNLRKVFQFTCNPKTDYKMWSPIDPFSGQTCLLGRRIQFQRRISRVDCYNGRDFVRARVTQNCSCTREDFECDIGFRSAHNYSGACIRDPASNLMDPHKPPVPCRVTWKRSKGYRKVAGDTCSGGDEHRYVADVVTCPLGQETEFLLFVSAREISHFNLESKLKNSYPIQNLHDVVDVDFNYKKSCLYWSQRTSIKRVCKSGNYQTQTVVSGQLTNAASLAVDWISDNIYWIEGTKRQIQMAKANGTYRKVIYKDKLQCFMDNIVLDPKHGYMFWLARSCNGSRLGSRIMKANLDGSNASVVIGRKFVRQPNGLAIDDQTERLFWTDSDFHRIMSATIQGTDLHVIAQGNWQVPLPRAITVFKDMVYWSDIRKHAILARNKYGFGNVRTIYPYGSSLVRSMKAVYPARQLGKNPCVKNNGGCSHLCVGRPQNEQHGANRTCLCPDSMMHSILPDGNERCTCGSNDIDVNGICMESTNKTCDAQQFACKNGRCIPSTWTCDRDNDCGDQSDEQDCPYSTCASHMFTCSDGRCIPMRWKCDGEADCRNATDEENCSPHKCLKNQFQCHNGRCIPENWVCDFDNDCHDNSDETLEDCQNRMTTIPTNTTHCNQKTSFQCVKGYRSCIAKSWVCDGTDDCGDNSDEFNCTNRNTSATCGYNTFPCGNGTCIPQEWVCNGYSECYDSSDEANCTRTSPYWTTTSRPYVCRPYQFQCRNGACISARQRCDHIDDCGDWSDEMSCPSPSGHFSCPIGTSRCNYFSGCVATEKFCNGRFDCPDNSDEYNCRSTTGRPHPTCSPVQFRCNDGNCISGSWLCDGERDCPNGEDEINCIRRNSTRGPNEFCCVASFNCIPHAWVCDGQNDCADASDEVYCDHSTNHPYSKPVHPYSTPVHPYSTATYPTFQCQPGQFKCKDSSACIDMENLCNGIENCLDSSDETLPICERALYVQNLVMVKHSAGVHNFTVAWNAPPNPKKLHLKYLPQIRAFHDKYFTNQTETDKLTFTFLHLVAEMGYVVRVRVIMVGKLRLRVMSPPSREINGFTRAGLPSAPQCVRVIGLATKVEETYNLKIEWKSPKKPNGAIRGYNVFIKRKPSFIYGKQVVPVLTNRRTPNVEVTYIVHGLEQGHDYNVKVQAFTNYGAGIYSKEQKITLNASLVIGTVDLKTVTYKSSKNDVTVAWKVPPSKYAIEGSYVHLKSKATGESKTCKTTKLTCALNNLSCGTTYNLTLQLYNNLSTGPQSEVKYITTKGKELGKPLNLSITLHTNTAASLSWSPPDKKKTKYVYKVYYDSDSSHMRDWNIADFSFKKTTSNNQILLPDLNACEQYYFRVKVVGPECKGDLSNAVKIKTKEDLKAPPKYLKVQKATPNLLKVTWEAACDFVSTPMVYLISVMNNKTKEVTTQQTQIFITFNMSYEFNEGIERGATYIIAARTNTMNSRPTGSVSAIIPPYPAPRDFKTIPADAGTVVVDWDTPVDAPKKYHFEIWYGVGRVEGDMVFLPEKYELKQKCNTTYFTFYNLKHGNHYFKVRLVPEHGYPGEFTRVEDAFVGYIGKYAGPSAARGGKLGTTNWVAIVVSVIVICIALGVVLAVYIIRHKRLQNSFLSFANSHYDTRSGTTRFSTGDTELDGDEDSPMITGFSDDEPLVIA